MYNIKSLLEKLNSSDMTAGNMATREITLGDIVSDSFSALREQTKSKLSWGETAFLYRQAQLAGQENKMAESRILSRANPQLANAVSLGIRQSAHLRSYDSLFGQRASKFVEPGSAASMFSPAAYLTELYREAKELHPANSAYRLDNRRADLASLSLSQHNMDEEISTLSLSNEILLEAIQTQESQSREQIMEMLATARETGATPFHLPYETIRQAIVLQDEAFAVFNRNPLIAQKVDLPTLLSIRADISPDLYHLLTEEITEENSAELTKKNFGDTDVNFFRNPQYLSKYYELTSEEIAECLAVFSSGNNAYVNDRLLKIFVDDDYIDTYLIKRTAGSGYNHLYYMDLFYKGNNTFYIKTKFKESRGLVSVRLSSPRSVYLNQINGPTEAGVVYQSRDFVLEESDFAGDFMLNLLRYPAAGTSEANQSTSAAFRLEKNAYAFNLFLLKLNKLIRLYKATGIAPKDILAVTQSEGGNHELTINEATLNKLFYVNYTQRRFTLEVADALVLCGFAIDNSGDQQDLFTRLFNTPRLNDRVFAADDAALSLVPGQAEDAFRLAVMKRAFQVNDNELFQLWTLANGGVVEPFSCTLRNLSALYRVKLLAQTQGLSVAELAMLLSVTPFAGQKLLTPTDDDITTLLHYLEQMMQWLRGLNWTVSDAWLMVTPSYSTDMTPDIESLIVTLRNGLSGQTFADDQLLLAALAPFIASATQLDTDEMARATLQWLNQLMPSGLSVAAFLALALKTSLTADETSSLIAFCQKLAQLVLIVRNTGISTATLSMLIAQPSLLQSGAGVLPNTLTMLYDLTRFQHFILRCGSLADRVLLRLKEGRLDTETVAQALNLDSQGLSQALKQASDKAYFPDWQVIDSTLQWQDIATTLSITPVGVARLIALKYANTLMSPGWSEWTAVSDLMQGGLNARQTDQLLARLAEVTSTALSAWFIAHYAPAWVNDRDTLYSYLLIDNQVSAEIKTTRVAEAIASIQLYVNRALGNQEEGALSSIRTRRFFQDWERWNKRYSTWAGVSQLAYYPENYIDPTLRIGQTEMMSEMLQTVSQSQLTADNVEEAFKAYMTRFEEVANLDVISGYHDSVSDRNGITWLLGRSTIGDYYWRKADIGMLSEGKLPANAWSEWKKITTAISAVNNLVRPVIFQSRLYIVWVESKELASGDTANKSMEYIVKYAHILHDGRWSAPVAVPINQIPSSNVGMYCAQDIEVGKLNILFYEKQIEASADPLPLFGLVISNDGKNETLDTTQVSEIAFKVYTQLDTTTVTKLNTPYGGDVKSIVVYEINALEQIWGADYYTSLTGSQLRNIHTTEFVDGKFTLSFDAMTQLAFQGRPGTRAEIHTAMMKRTGNIGDTFYIPRLTSKGTFAPNGEALARKATVDEFYVQGSMSGCVVSINDNAWFAAEEFGNDLWCARYIEKTLTKVLASDRKNANITGTGSIPASDLSLTFTNFTTLNTAVAASDVSLKIVAENGGTTQTVNMGSRSSYSFDKTEFILNAFNINFTKDIFNNNKANITATFTANAHGRELGSETLGLTLINVSTLPVITLNRTSDSAQYLQYGAYRIRVNTLFAKQLVARANAGLDTVLSMTTQQIQEPQLGEGSWIAVTFDRYDRALHGDGTYQLFLVGAVSNNESDSRQIHLCASGTVSANTQTVVNVFLPYNVKTGNEPGIAYLGVRYSDQSFTASAATMQAFRYNTTTKAFEETSTTNTGRTRGLESRILTTRTEPMDFSGGNALYFWEMFYYVPMMVFKRLLQESRFDEATRWIKYIWNPEGYFINGSPAQWQWNVRPLQEDTSWNTTPLDSVDPDAVAQADPMHYKVATFMGMLDLLIARGDMAYRKLERDTLNEAKMWYMQALSQLGDEPYLNLKGEWSAPLLSDAAAQTASMHAALLAVRQQSVMPEQRTANSLTALFLPQYNEKLQGYWRTLRQRMYNLRHNLSIDGQPLALSIFAKPADPAALLSAAVSASQGGDDLPTTNMALYRFPVMLENAKNMVAQLSQFGSLLLSIAERQDAETLSELLQTQASELVLQSVAMQDHDIAIVDAEQAVLEASRKGAQSRFDSYSALYEENINAGERSAINLSLAASSISAGASALHMVAAAAEMVPNIYGFAVGGSRYGALFNASAIGLQLASDGTRVAAERISQSEIWRRRREEWEIQRNAAESELKQIDAQLASLALRRQAAVLQKTYVETQQAQAQAQLLFLQNKFSNKALYNWLRGRLAAIYYQFYDLAVSRCLMAQKAWQWEFKDEATTFIRPGAWQGTWAGLMAGETLMLNLAQMEKAALERGQRVLEATRTVSLAQYYAEQKGFNFVEQIAAMIANGSGIAGPVGEGIKLFDSRFMAYLKLADLNISGDYLLHAGRKQYVKQVGVTLPALVGPYQDVQAELTYSGSDAPALARGCTTQFVSHGMNDSGQFQLDFNDSRYLPFEGVDINGDGTLILTLPNTLDKQRALLASLNDIILHIRYVSFS
ncbi:neuraminidase-like domain-containing protein [Kalamiella sp. sgz302252]|uniref:Tc toxin subunit A-related protein n=1 Tax=Pantoea sp. sgz302252 TaxID=3341827 RepID=UPI0036D41B07